MLARAVEAGWLVLVLALELVLLPVLTSLEADVTACLAQTCCFCCAM